MKYAVSSDIMNEIEKQAIEQYGIDAILLMEHAAIAIALRIKEHAEQKKCRILCVCGTGNNGGDGIAAARILACQGYYTKIILVGNPDKTSYLTKKQLSMAEKLNIDIAQSFDIEKYDIIIDALFGIGFHAVVEGMASDTKMSQSMAIDAKVSQSMAIDAKVSQSMAIDAKVSQSMAIDANMPPSIYKEAIQYINQSGSYIISADIPSGIYADTGNKEGEAVYADETVTFGICKIGLLLYPGAYHAGKVITADIGLPECDILRICKEKGYKYYEKTDIISSLPRRTAYSNKGNYGKVLVIAGCKSSPGAAYLTASAAYRTGAGLVKVLSVKESVHLINIKLPEGLTAEYNEADYESVTVDALSWADTIIAGPGLGMGEIQEKIIDIILSTCNKPLVLDADALNIISNKLDKNQITRYEERINQISKILPSGTILTPHLKELSRLLNVDISKIQRNLIDIAHKCTYNNTLMYVLKDARTIISSMNSKYINLSGNNGMATGGSGDVLAGIIAGFLSGKLSNEVAAALGVYVHGLVGDAAAKEKGVYSLLAGDIIDSISKVLI